MKFLSMSFMLLLSASAFSQTSYSGSIDKYPIQLFVSEIVYSSVEAVYSYDKFGTPIAVDGEFEKGTLTLKETNANEEVTAKMVFKNYSADANEITGQWTDQKSGKVLGITLKKNYQVRYLQPYPAKTEWLQTESTPQYYFKTVNSEKGKEERGRVVALKVFEKKTNKLFQEIAVDCEVRGFNSLWVEDYNKDGIQDFSIFKEQFAGANTSSLYFAKDKTGKFVSIKVKEDE
jgi:hypothetical protein